MMNHCDFIGRLTKDPELKYANAGGTSFCKFTLAVERPPRAGKQKEADFPRITVFGKQAESCGKNLAKGDLVGVSCRFQTSTYEDTDGNTIYSSEFIAESVDFLEWGEKRARSKAPENEQAPVFAPVQPDSDDVDDY